ncbi:MAG: hypothetical protein HFJ35_03170 [Clostridia bacterium]|nr:hypothetical protein [Clostridia bacterium]
MKKYKKKDLLIWILMIFSCIVIIMHLKFEFKDNFLIVLLNLSYSYFAACLFYIGQVCIPALKDKKNALTFAQPYIDKISCEMSYFLDFTNTIFEITNGELNILGDDDGYIYYQNNNTIMSENYREYFIAFEKSIKCEIEHLKQNYLYFSLPDELLDILANIEIQNYPCIASIASLYPLCKSYDSLGNELNTIQDYLIKIKKYSKQTNSNTIVLLNDDEKEKYKKNILKYEPITKEILSKMSKN